MAIIDPEGYFGGDRFDDVSDQARAMWPTFFLASNTVARIELNYRKVCAAVFSRWKKPPTEKQFWGWIEEYQSAYLIFVYEVNGTMWGQWDTSEKFLPRHKLASDLRTPKPPENEWSLWKQEYSELKSSKSNNANNFKIFRKPAKTFADLHTDARGVGGGVGIGGGIGGGENKTQTPAAGADGCEVVPITPSAMEWFHSEFWPTWPVKDNKADAERAALKVPPADRNAVIAGVRVQTPRILAMERPIHASTFLNKRRWEDESKAAPLFKSPTPIGIKKSFVQSVESVMRERVAEGLSPL